MRRAVAEQCGLDGVVNLIEPRRVRYIKLGEGGRWERICLEKGTLRIGFGSGGSERFQQCLAGAWGGVRDGLAKDGKPKGKDTQGANELRLFFEDDGSTLWLTFIGERLYWGLIDPTTPPWRDGGQDGSCRRIRGGWSTTDVKGMPLTKDRLSGALNKLAEYRGTSCSVDVADYAVRRINALARPEVDRVEAAVARLKEGVEPLLRLLTWRDFETLVDLIFSTSGWRRIGRVGGTQKTLDIDLVLPSTGERALVQVKSRTSQAQLDDYIGQLATAGPYDRMFYVFHTGSAATADDKVRVIGPKELTDLVIDSGLVNWVIRKAS